MWTTSNANGITPIPFPVGVRSLRWETFIGDSLACLTLGGTWKIVLISLPWPATVAHGCSSETGVFPAPP